MTFEQLMQELFVYHWLFTTIAVPPVTFIYAWITDSTGWWICSFILAAIYRVIWSSK